MAAPPRFAATGGSDYIGWVGIDQDFYTIPNVKADAIREHPRHARARLARHRRGLQQVRGESFLDEVAQPRGKSIRSTLRLELTKDQPRAQRRDQGGGRDVGLQAKRQGRGLGIAFSDYHGTF